MSVFIGGRVPSEHYMKYIQNFYNNYDAAWLWASDEVLTVLSKYMQFKIDYSPYQQECSGSERFVVEAEEKELFLDCIFAMRKDMFKYTKLSKEDYKFIKF